MIEVRWLSAGVRALAISAAVGFGMIAALHGLSSYLVGVIVPLFVTAPLVAIERAVARFRPLDPSRPRVIPLVYAHILAFSAAFAEYTSAGPPLGRVGTAILVTGASSWLVIAAYGALGRRFRVMLVAFSLALLGSSLALAGVDWSARTSEYREGALVVFSGPRVVLVLWGLALLDMLQWAVDGRALVFASRRRDRSTRVTNPETNKGDVDAG